MTRFRLTLAALGAPAARRLRRLRTRLRVRRAWAGARPPAPAELPEPFLFGDADRGRSLVAGIWEHLGRRVALGETALWDAGLPDPRLEAERQSFAWLDDLAALGSRAARARAQRWTLDWIRRYGRGRGPGWRPELAGRRVLRWTAHARLLAEGMAAADAARLWRALAAHGAVLARFWADAPPGLPRVEALTGAALAFTLIGDAGLDPVLADLGRLAEALIDPAGTTPSRAPGELAEIVILLIWSARLLENAGRHADPAHLYAIARAVPIVRALRLGDGTMARFHGGGPGLPDRLDQALAELRLGPQPKPRLAMGYARLAGGRVVAIMDGAAPPLGPGAPRAHAGTLAFEMSAGRTPIVVNAGPGQIFGPGAARAARTTAAHSTVEIDGTPSARLCAPGLAARAYGGWLEDGPTLVSVRQAQDATGQWLLATHDGYVATHGLLHERRLFVDARGQELRGEEIVYVTDGRARDIFDRVTRRRRPLTLTARFHLHAAVAAELDPVRQLVELTLPSGEAWVFRCAGGRLDLDEAVQFDPLAAAPVASQQILVTAEVIEYLGQVNWSFMRLAGPAETSLPPPLSPRTP